MCVLNYQMNSKHMNMFILPGLTLDEKVACTSRHNLSSKSKSSSGEDDSNIAVPLILLTVWKTAGVTVSPASRDLKCKLNGEDIETEAHFIPGQFQFLLHFPSTKFLSMFVFT